MRDAVSDLLDQPRTPTLRVLVSWGYAAEDAKVVVLTSEYEEGQPLGDDDAPTMS